MNEAVARPELLAWILIHFIGVIINIGGLITGLKLAARPGRQTGPVLRGLSAVAALLIHLASIIVGTAVVAELNPGYVWGYAVFQGGLFNLIGLINALGSRWGEK